MKLRLAAAFLWFYYGWYATTLIADLLGVGRAFGPIVGFIGAAIVLRDPIRLRWSQRSWSDLGIQRARAMERLNATSANN